MLNHTLEQQMQYLSKYYHAYYIWLCGTSSYHNIEQLIALVNIIESALIQMDQESGQLLTRVYFCGDDENRQVKMVWACMQKCDKIKLMSSFFRCLQE